MIVSAFDVKVNGRRERTRNPARKTVDAAQAAREKF
jgi:hypothetical protein